MYIIWGKGLRNAFCKVYMTLSLGLFCKNKANQGEFFGSISY